MNNKNKLTTMKTLSISLIGLAIGTTSSAQEVQGLFGETVPGLTAAENVRFVEGRDEFNEILTAAAGLGPIFNDSSCGQCHSTPVAGGFSDKKVDRAGIAGPPFDPLAALGGSLFQQQSIEPPVSVINPNTGVGFVAGDCLETIPVQATVTAKRLTPPTFGAGLVQSIDDNDILFYQNNPPSGFVAGIARPTNPFEGGSRLGKFGWKGGVATMLTFSADASLNEMGLTNRFIGSENAPNGDAVLLAACDQASDPEDFPDGITGLERIDRQQDFQIFLSAPAQTPKSGMSGETVFNTIGCADCHVGQAYTTMSTGVLSPALANKEIKPYSDFLLHDMGALGDGIVDGIATEQLMKTSPLWGLWPRAAVSLLHDGSATGGSEVANITAAIQAHDGEAATSVGNFNGLSQPDIDAMMVFLRSLGSSEFDFERNNNRDQFDWFFMHTLFTGPGGSLTPDDDAAISDANQDGSFDMGDYSVFMRAFTG